MEGPFAVNLHEWGLFNSSFLRESKSYARSYVSAALVVRGTLKLFCCARPSRAGTCLCLFRE